jgi:hypothetical protein
MQTATMSHGDDVNVVVERESPLLAGCALNKTTNEGAQEKTPTAKAAAAPQGGLAGMLWFTGWLFTIGFAQLVWWKAILGLVLWPYFLALALR